MITRCPSCELAFRISEAQLAAAAGLVRCGACLKVFNAKDHLDKDYPCSDQQEQQPATPAANKPPSSLPSSQTLPPSPSLVDDDDFFIDDNFDLTLLDRLTGTDSASQNSPRTTHPREQELQQETQQAQEATPMEGKHDSAIATDSAANQSPTAAEPLSVPTPKPVETGGEADAAPAVTMTAQPQPADPNLAAPEPAALQPVEITSATDSAAPGPSVSAGPPITVESPITVEPLTVGPSLTDSAPHLPPTFDADHFGADSDRTVPRSHWLWYPLLLIGIVALPLQYAHFNADVLGQNPRWRPAMEMLCRATRCTLAPLTNRSLVATTNLVVRSHPDQAGALRVDATLINRATFAQPYPHLILSFEDLQGDLVASRNFAPAEYLGGELKGATLMPSQQPVKLELDILDPGPEAVSYSLTATDSSRQ